MIKKKKIGNMRMELRKKRLKREKKNLQRNELCEFLKPGNIVSGHVCMSKCTHAITNTDERKPDTATSPGIQQ